MQVPKVINITGLDGTIYTIDVPIKKNKYWAIIQDYNYVYEKVPLQDYAIWFMNNRNESSRFILYKQLQEPYNFKIVEDYCKQFCTQEQFDQLTLKHKFYMFCCNLKTFEVCPHCKTRPKSIKNYREGYAGCCGNSSCMSYENHRCNPGRGIVKMKQTKANRSPEKVKEEFNKALQKNIDLYGTEEEKLNRHNIKSIFQIKKIKDNRQNTFKNFKNGHPARDPKCIEKGKQTSKEKYDTEYPAQNKKIMNKIMNTKIANGTLVSPKGNSEIVIVTHSNKEFQTQGYSYMSLNDVINIGYDVSDIQTEQKCPPIKYFAPDSVIRNYTPDIYIESEKLYIETKSSYWLGYKPNFILAKLLGCLEQGYNCILDVKNPNGHSNLRISFQSNSNSRNILDFVNKIESKDKMEVRHIKMNENLVKNKFKQIILLFSKLSKEMLK